MAYDRTKDYSIGADRNRETRPAREAFAITAAGTDLDRYVRALWLNTSGTVSGIPVEARDDTVVTFTGVPTGFFTVSFRRVTACPASTLGVI